MNKYLYLSGRVNMRVRAPLVCGFQFAKCCGHHPAVRSVAMRYALCLQAAELRACPLMQPTALRLMQRAPADNLSACLCGLLDSAAASHGLSYQAGSVIWLAESCPMMLPWPCWQHALHPSQRCLTPAAMHRQWR